MLPQDLAENTRDAELVDAALLLEEPPAGPAPGAILPPEKTEIGRAVGSRPAPAQPEGIPSQLADMILADLARVL